MMTTHAELVGFYSYPLVALSVFISIFAAYAALDFSRRVTTSLGFVWFVWLCIGATVMGVGICAVNYVGMEAFRLPVLVLYDWPTVLCSLLTAILASGVAFYFAAKPSLGLHRRLFGSIVMGLGIAAALYIGIAAMRLPAIRVHSSGLIFLSIALAIAISDIALRLSFDPRGKQAPRSWRKFSGALIMGTTVPVMHYVGMAAVSFVPIAAVQGSVKHTLSAQELGLASTALVVLILLGIVIDSIVRDRRRSTKAQLVAENLAQLRAVFDNMTDGIVVVDSEKRLVLHNQPADNLLGLTSKTLSLEGIIDTFEVLRPTGEPLPLDEWPLYRATQGDYCTNEEIEIRRRDNGKSVTTEITTVRIAVSGETTRKFIVSLRDITERKQSDETRMRLATLVESSEDGIIGKTDKGIVTSWNRGAEKIYGYPAAEMLGQPIQRLLPANRSDEDNMILDRIRRGEVVEHYETVRVRKDGQHINVSLTISPIRSANGTIIGASKIVRDITHRMKIERQLQQSQKMDAIGQLTGGIAHDFNNLLGIVIGNLDLLESQISHDDDIGMRVQVAQKAALRAADLTRRLLAFSSNETLSPSPTNLHGLISSMIEMTNRVIGPEIKIATSFDESISLILIDPSGLESALVNLMVNARDAMPKGGAITISTRVTIRDTDHPPAIADGLKAGRHAAISVSDTGQGMSQQTLERVFEPFFTTKPRGKGTGLGLAMVYGFVKQSEGTVRIYSEPGHGTTVTLYLPLIDDASIPQRKVFESRGLFDINPTVLVVDDEVDLLDIATAYLAEMGCKAYTAVDSNDALQIIKCEEDIDLMVTDVIMPGGMNGVELAQKARLLNPRLKIIYCSGFPADALAERSMQLLDGPLLHKPYQREEFRALVHRTMETEKKAGRPK